MVIEIYKESIKIKNEARSVEEGQEEKEEQKEEQRE